MDYVDRRKRNQIDKIEEVADLPKEAAPEVVLESGNDTWKEISYMTASLKQPSGMIQLGKAIGIRGDDRVFDVDYVFPPFWREDESWQKEARKRLDTFLGCSCSELGICNMHIMLQESWMKADSERLTVLQQRGMPNPLKAFLETQARARESQSKSNVLAFDPKKAN